MSPVGISWGTALIRGKHLTLSSLEAEQSGGRSGANKEHKKCCVSHKSLLPLKLPACFFPNSIAIKLFLAAVQKTTEQTSPRTPPSSPQLRTSTWDIGDRQSSSLIKVWLHSCFCHVSDFLQSVYRSSKGTKWGVAESVAPFPSVWSPLCLTVSQKCVEIMLNMARFDIIDTIYCGLKF